MSLQQPDQTTIVKKEKKGGGEINGPTFSIFSPPDTLKENRSGQFSADSMGTAMSSKGSGVGRFQGPR